MISRFLRYSAFLVLLVALARAADASELEIDGIFLNTGSLPGKGVNSNMELPALDPLHSVRLNEQVHVLFLARGYGVDSQGRTNIELDIRIIGPKKTLLYEVEKFSVMRIARDKGLFLVFDPVLDFMIEKGDQTGEYSVSFRVIDSVSRRARAKSISINVTE